MVAVGGISVEVGVIVTVLITVGKTTFVEMLVGITLEMLVDS
jgi:hypothetical protein